MPSGLLVGKSHKKGGIDIKTPTTTVEMEGGEVIINKEASQKHCETLSEINQSAGNGVAIPCAKAAQAGTMKAGGAIAGSVLDEHTKAVSDLHKAEKMQETMKTANSIIRSKLQVTTRLIDQLGFSEATATKLVQGDRYGRVGFAQYQLTNNNATIKRLKQRVKMLEGKVAGAKSAASGSEENYSFEGGTIEVNYPADRVQIFFDSIPDYTQRSELKRNGWKWSPSNKAWQRKITPQAISNAKHLLKAEPRNVSAPSPFSPSPLERAGVRPPAESEPQPALAYKNQYELNKSIEAFLTEKGPDHTNYSVVEKLFIRKYSGYGGLDKFGTTGKGGLFEYYTPRDVIEKMWALAYKYGYNNGSVLEPSIATGEFLQFAKPENHAVGYEINEFSAQICKILYPTAQVHVQPFEQLFIKNNWTIKDKTDELGKFDLVIGNPPYGDFSIVQSRYMSGMGEKDHTQAKNYVEYFTRRGLDLLNSGGLLIYIVGAQILNGGNLFLDSGNTPVKEYLAAHSTLLDAYRLPDSIFERTGVTSEIIVLKKN